MSPKMRTYLYFGTLGLFSLAMIASGVMDLAHPPSLLEAIRHLGYPVYVVTLLGIWKLLGVAAVLAPRLPRLKEWAYAGFAFDLSGAALSHLVSADGTDKVVVPLFLLAIGLASWALRPASRRLEPATSAS